MFNFTIQIFKTSFSTNPFFRIIVLIYIYKKEFIIITAVDSWKRFYAKLRCYVYSH